MIHLTLLEKRGKVQSEPEMGETSSLSKGEIFVLSSLTKKGIKPEEKGKADKGYSSIRREKKLSVPLNKKREPRKLQLEGEECPIRC